IVSNPSHHTLRVQHPENRLVLTFIVTDALGNIVAPKGVGKVDPEMRMVDIDARSDYEYQFEDLRFLTNSAQFTYQLKNGGVYKVIALFRPAGSEGPGFTSNEVSINIF
ncbi:MAG: hypothetical protein ACC707_09070, partial [Thiohalomonadales bacterium]